MGFDEISIPKSDLNSEMRCGILSNSNGEIMIIHDQPMSSEIQWVEYDYVEDIFSLVHEDGSTQNLGFEFDKTMKDNLKHGSEVILAYVQNGQIKKAYKTNIVIQSI